MLCRISVQKSRRNGAVVDMATDKMGLCTRRTMTL